ncbi:hypothetical protein FB451DRAFT_673074 [Mycena latifolia]|nr:hypothetical protein FB451DRAFT_673074 [Mycena latifolia]
MASNNFPCTEGSRPVRAQIDELEPHMASIEEGMGFLASRPAALLHSLDDHKSTASPIRRLPPEILGEIFAFSVHSTYYFGDVSEVSGPLSHQAPWVFTRVCRRWAAVALGTPGLWSMVSLDLDRLGERGAVSMTKLWLARSRNLPLTIKIFHDSDALDRPRLDSHLVLDAVMQHSERWQNAYISISLPLLFQLANLHGRLAALTTLTITVDIAALQDRCGDLVPLRRTFIEAPQLTAFCASFWDDRLLRSPFAFPLHQLTRLSTTFTSSAEALCTLRKLSNIVDCRLQYEEHEALPLACVPILLPHLRVLTIQTTLEQDDPVEMQHTDSLLNYLKTPRLEDLSTHNTADADAVLALFARSGCAGSLRSLRFYLDPSRGDMFLTLLQRLPRLATLELGDFNGALTAPASVATFFGVALHCWLQYPSPRQSLRVRIVDRMYDGDVSPLAFSAMRRDGLWVEISPVSSYRCVIMDSFN